MARAIQQVTASDVLNAIRNNTVQQSNTPVLDALTNTSAAIVDNTASLFGALRASGGNFIEHYKLEREIQNVRSKKRLEAAAERAASRINAALAA